MIPADRIVVEVAADPIQAPPGWAWYEVDLDAVGVAPLAAAPVGTRLIGATRRNDPDSIADLVVQHAGPLTHLQFECSSRVAAHAAARIRDRGLIPLPARHLNRPPEHPDVLLRHAHTLAGTGADLIKIVYPAPDPALVDYAVSVLAGWPHQQVALSVTPTGTRAGRIHAALAGSRLVWVPLRDTVERLAVDWWRRLTQPSPALPAEPPWLSQNGAQR